MRKFHCMRFSINSSILISFFLFYMSCFPFKVNSQESNAQMANLMYRPNNGRPFIEIKSNKRQEKIQYTTSDQEQDYQKRNGFFLSYLMGHSLSPQYLFSITWDQYVFEEMTQFQTDGLNGHQESSSIKTRSKGLHDPYLNLMRRLLREESTDPEVDIFFTFSPKSGTAKIGSVQETGNMKRGSYVAGTGLIFGLKEGPLQMIGKFFLNHSFAGKKKDLSNQSIVKTEPYSHFGAESSLQYQLRDPLFISLIGALEVGSTQEIKMYNTSIEPGQGLTKKIATGLDYTLSKNILVNTKVSRNSSDYQLSIKSDEKKIETKYWEFSLGIRFQL